MKFDYFEVMGRAKKKYARAMEPVCRKWELTKNELDVLLFLNNNPEFDRASDVVTHRGMTKSHVSLSATSLESKGLLTRNVDPEDRRTIRLELTAAGSDIAAAGRECQENFFRKVFEGITLEEMEFWLRMMNRVGSNIAQMED